MNTSFIENSEINQANPNVLVHHQIKGAKWGIHRGPPYPLENGINTKIKRRGASPVNKEKGEASKRSNKSNAENKSKGKYTFDINDRVSDLSNEELRARIERFKTVNEYNKYVSEIKNGQKFLTRMSKVLKQMTVTGNTINAALQTGRKTAELLGLIEPQKKDDKKDKNKNS